MAPGQQGDEGRLSAADLWDKKVKEGMTPAAATAYVYRRHGSPAAAKRGTTLPAPKIRSDASATDRMLPPVTEGPREAAAGFARSIEQGATLGFGDEINAGVRAALSGETLDESLAAERGSLRQFQERHPGGALAAELAGGLGGGLGLGRLASKGARLLGAGGRAAASTAAATRAARIAQALKQTGAGAAAGGVTAVGTSEGDVGERLEAAPRGAAFGAGFVGGAKAAGAVAGKTISPVARALLSKFKPSESTPGIGRAASRVGLTVEDAARADLLKQIERSGLSLQDVETAAGNAPGASMLLDVGGPAVLRRAEGAATVPSRGATQIETALRQRVADQPRRVQFQAADALTGAPRENAVESARQLVESRSRAARPLYERAYEGEPLTDPRILEALELPQFGEAYKRGQAIAELGGVELPDAGRTKLSVRTNQGRLRADLKKVSTKNLEAERDRLQQLNADEEAYHASVKDAGYREAYEELPDAERTGRTRRTRDEFGNKIKRQAEDLPDADGAVDAERLAADNKIIKDFSRSGIVRQARYKAMRRIDDELQARAPDTSFDDPWDVPDDVPAGPKRRPEVSEAGVPIQGLDYMKRGLDDIIESKMKSGAMGRTEARELRKKLNEVLALADESNPDFQAARRQFAGDSELMAAHERGAGFLKESLDEIAADWPGLSDGERELYRRGALSALSEKLSTVTDGRDVTRILQNPLMRDKLRTILPDEAAADRFMERLAGETRLHQNAQSVLGGSPTARRLAQQGDDAGVGPALEGMSSMASGSPGRLAGALLRMVTRGPGSGLSESRVDALAPLLTASGQRLTGTLNELKGASARQARVAEAVKRGKQAGRTSLGQIGGSASTRR